MCRLRVSPNTVAMGLLELIWKSKTYRLARTARRWAAGSVVLSLLGQERALAGLVSVFVLGSVASIFRSNLGSGVKFLSFLLLFVGIALLTERVVDPPTD